MFAEALQQLPKNRVLLALDHVQADAVAGQTEISRQPHSREDEPSQRIHGSTQIRTLEIARTIVFRHRDGKRTNHSRCLI